VIVLTITEHLIAVGIIQAVTPEDVQVPDDKMPVYIYSVEECASGYLQNEQVVLWPKYLLLNAPTCEVKESPDKKESKEVPKTGTFQQIGHTVISSTSFL